MSEQRSIRELEARLKSHIKFIFRSAEMYDLGDTDESFRIATSLRVLFHDTKFSSSLLKQLSLTGPGYFSSGEAIQETDTSVSVGLSKLVSGVRFNSTVDGGHLSFEPSFHNVNGYTIDLETWWNGERISIVGGKIWSRSEIVRLLADKDGSHVDGILSSNYLAMIDAGWSAISTLDGSERSFDRSENFATFAQASVRQLAFEISRSKNLVPFL